MLSERFLVEISRLDPYKQANIPNENVPLLFKVTVLRYVSQEQPRGRICVQGVYLGVAPSEGGREEGKAANKRSINTKVTPVNSWSSIPLGNSGAERVGSPRSELFQARGRRAGRFIRQAVLAEGCIQAVLASAPPACCVRAAQQVLVAESPQAKKCSLQPLEVGLASVRDNSRAPTASAVGDNCTETIPT